jgi:hypothetical protein
MAVVALVFPTDFFISRQVNKLLCEGRPLAEALEAGAYTGEA